MLDQPVKAGSRPAKTHDETSDTYVGLVAQLNPHWRVVTCRDAIQWILQKRDAQRSGRPRWTGTRYFRSRDALLRVSRTLCGRIDPCAMAILAALPAQIGGAS
jgi:hypothetical protein